ncbi:hypothetical protein M0R04_12770 [Candidatus Dojkabacteria bacterium]|jgi:hypothetical protein|nr:hypothetical protein [Candidatus Dojkabacteria bacterium]
MKDATKAKIEKLVRDWIYTFPEEYDKFKVFMSAYKSNLLNEDTAEIKADYVRREIHKLPEELFMNIYQTLDADEMKEFDSIQGARWFAKKFKVFATPKLI